MLFRSGITPTILRLFNVYGDLDKEQGVISIMLRKAIAGEPLLIKGGDQLRDFVFLHNVVEAFKQSYDHTASQGKTINVGSGIGLSIKEIASMIQHSFPQTNIKYEPADQQEYSIYADISKIKSTLGFSPTDPREGIPKFVEECKNRYRK